MINQPTYYPITFITIAHDKDTDFLNIPSTNNQMNYSVFFNLQVTERALEGAEAKARQTH